MHSEDIIGRLREEFITRYKGCMYMAALPAKSSAGMQISQCRRDLRGTITGRSGELAMEVERLRLIRSEDPEERAKGEAMVTPGSILASQTTEDALMAPQEMKGQTIGEIPDSEAGIEDLNAEAEGDDIDAGERAPAADADAGVGAGTAADVDAEVVANDMAGRTKSKSKKKTATPMRKLYVWMLLEFPAVPEKGGFDVTRLRQSKYFFH